MVQPTGAIMAANVNISIITLWTLNYQYRHYGMIQAFSYPIILLIGALLLLNYMFSRSLI